MSAHATVAPHDCVGSALYAHVLRGRVRRIVPRENEAVNETWISDRDRFSCEGLYVQDRLQKPLVRREGRLIETGWEEALEVAAAGLTRVAEERGGQALGALVSPSATVEEGSLLRQLMSALGSANVDHRLRQRDFRRTVPAGPAPGLGTRFSDVESLDSLLLVGSDLRSEAPILAHRVRKAALAGARVSYLDLAEREYLHPIGTSSVQHPRDWARALGQLAGRALRGRRRALWLGGLAMRHPAYAELLETAAEAAAGRRTGPCYARRKCRRSAPRRRHSRRGEWKRGCGTERGADEPRGPLPEWSSWAWSRIWIAWAAPAMQCVKPISFSH